MYWTDPVALERCRSAILQNYVYRSPEALVFFDHRGALLYQSELGAAQFSRWNRVLSRGQESASLPAALNFVEGAGSILEHPTLPSFAARFEEIRGGFVLRFFEDRVEGDGGDLSAEALSALQKLSRSEQRVARLAMRGLRNDQIAEHICRSKRTVEFQLNSAFRKLKIRNRVQLSRMLV